MTMASAPKTIVSSLCRLAGRLAILSVLTGLSVWSYYARPLAAQQAVPTDAPVADTAEERARQQILHSDRWQDMQFDFGQWLTEQSLYDHQQVEETLARMRRGVSRMTAAQLTRFLSDMEGRLDVLTSPAGREARVYFNKKFKVASAAYAKRIRQDLPDLVTTSPSQLDEWLAVHTKKRSAAQQRQITFNEARQQSVVSNQSQRQAESQERQRRAQRSAASTGSTASEFGAARDYFPARERPNYGMLMMGGGFF
jgi:hypothetical protein